MRNFIIALCLCIPVQSNAAISFNTLEMICGTPSDLCYGFLLGLFESELVHDQRVADIATGEGVRLPPIVTAQRNFCLPARYDRARSLTGFFESVRSELIPLVLNKARSKGIPKTRIIDDPAANVLQDAMLELYSCRLPDRTRREVIW